MGVSDDPRRRRYLATVHGSDHTAKLSSFHQTVVRGEGHTNPLLQPHLARSVGKSFNGEKDGSIPSGMSMSSIGCPRPRRQGTGHKMVRRPV